jgi:hypothetical protein
VEVVGGGMLLDRMSAIAFQARIAISQVSEQCNCLETDSTRLAAHATSGAAPRSRSFEAAAGVA